MKSKRDATSEETEKALDSQTVTWNNWNSNFEKTREYWEQKQEEAVAEGYKSEICSCGVTFLAFHHYVDCRKEGCPMSDGVSVLDRMI